MIRVRWWSVLLLFAPIGLPSDSIAALAASVIPKSNLVRFERPAFQDTAGEFPDSVGT